MRKIKWFTVICVLLNQITIQGQVIPQKNVIPPEAAHLGLFSTIPVSPYTGIPDISVPLHTMVIGESSYPIQASYHLASVKPNQQPTSLGLGWNLNTGGCIYRTVRGVCDEKLHKDNHTPGFYDNAHRLKNMTTSRFVEETKNIMRDDGKFYELSADEFSFSFYGYSGNFYYNEDKGWTVVSDQDIKVEFNPGSDGFLQLKDLRPEIPVSNWNASNYNQRFFNKFALITPDGARYEFGGKNATDYSISYYNRNNSDLVATTWHLSKISTPDQRVITFEYDVNNKMCELLYAPQSITAYNVECLQPHTFNLGRAGFTGFLIFPVKIQKITTPNETVTFYYQKDNNYANMFIDSFIAWKTKKEYNRFDMYEIINDPAFQFQLFIKNADSSSEYALRNSIKRDLAYYYLFAMSVKKKNTANTFYFDYNLKGRRKLSLITKRNGEYKPVVTEILGEHGEYYILYEIPPVSTDYTPMDYHFRYNLANQMPKNYMDNSVDSWGYYNGKKIEYVSDIDFTIRYPVESYTKSEILTEMVYPTRGKATFEFETHRYSSIVSASYDKLTEKMGSAGGLRIRQINNLDENDNLLYSTRYYYANDKKDNSKSSGVMSNYPTFEVEYISGNKTLEMKSKNGFFSSSTAQKSPNVGYSHVIVETLNKNGESEGYIKYHFSNYGKDVNGITHLDEKAFYSTVQGDSYSNSFSSKHMERGKLLTKEYYDKNDRLVKQINYEYAKTNEAYLTTATQFVVFFCTDPVFLSYSKNGSLTKTYTYSYLKTAETEKNYTANGVFENRRTFAYNKHKLLSKETLYKNQQDTYVVSYIYPPDRQENTTYKKMTGLNILSPVIEKSTINNSSEVIETFNYNLRSNIPFIEKYFQRVGGTTIDEFKVNATDRYANPLEIEEKGGSIKTILIWSFAGQRLVAKIENCTYQDVSEALLIKPEDISPFSNKNDIPYNKFENLRTKLPNSQVSIFRYDTEFFLESSSSPNGIMTYYKYDSFGRLREKYYYENNKKKILEIFDYHYSTLKLEY